MTIAKLLKELRLHQVVLRLEQNKLLCELPKQGIPDSLRSELLARKDELKAYISNLTGERYVNVDIPLRPNGQKILPLSFAQQRLWLIDQVEEGDSHYNTYFVFHAQGDLQIPILRQAFAEIVVRHESLRTCFVQVDGEPMQVVMPEDCDFANKVVTEICLSPEVVRDEQELQKFILQQIHHKFDLSKDLLLKVTVVPLAMQKNLIIFVIHHIASDGWSGALLGHELSCFYQAILEGHPTSLSPLNVQYADFALWQQEQVRQGQLEPLLAYWQEQLADLPPVHNFPLDKPRPPIQSFHGGRVLQVLSPQLHSQLQQLATQQGVTMFMLLETAFAILLSRWSNDVDVVLGVPIAGRTHPQLETLIGFFVNTLVIRTQLDPLQTFNSLLQKNKKTILEAFANQGMPFDKLVESVQHQRVPGITSLFQILFVMQNNKAANLALPGLQVEDIGFDGQIVKFDLELHATEKPSGLEMSWLYATSMFEHSSIERLHESFIYLLQSVVNDPECLIHKLPLTSEQENLQLADWNYCESNSFTECTVHKLIESQASLNPQQIALRFHGDTLTYRELNQAANQLAYHLLTYGIKPDSKVALLIDRSFSMVIAVLAILKAGACYVPLDTTLPDERINVILTDLGEVLVLTDSANQSVLKNLNFDSILLDDPLLQKNLLLHSEQDPLIDGLQSHHLAYVLHTSGSTGKPKAIAMPHGPLINLLKGISLQEPKLARAHTSIQFASIGFDMSFTDIFLTLSGGGSLVLIDAETQYDTASLVGLIKTHKVSALNLPYVMLQSLADYCLQHQIHLNSLECIISTAEQLKITKSIRGFFEIHFNCCLVNHYGPSETHVVTAMTMKGSALDWPELPPIGRPLINISVHLLDKYLNPVPIGAVGELYFGGSCLAREYLKQPELTSEKFIVNPHSPDSFSRLYKTGDLARVLPSGDLTFLGRIDNQVKINGFRIELNDIENALSSSSLIKEVMVLVKAAANGDNRLVAYATISDTSLPHGVMDGLTGPTSISDQLAQHVERLLPSYMIPAAFVLLKQFPLTSNGKVDRRALPEPDFTYRRVDYIEPRTEVERVLVSIWKETLGIDHISITDNFFQLGGHSLSAVRMLSKINLLYKTNISIKSIFSDATILSIATLIEAVKLNNSNINQLLVDDPEVEEGVF